MTVIIQISTRIKDYLIYVPPLQSLICSELKLVMEDESIIKIFHRAANDVLCFQRDFGIYIRGLIDTQQVYNYVERIKDKGQLISFKNLVASKLSTIWAQQIEKSTQAADWRVYPLPDELRKYAQLDSSLLLLCWQALKPQMRDGHWKGHKLDPIRQSNKQAAASYGFRKFKTARDEASRVKRLTRRVGGILQTPRLERKPRQDHRRANFANPIDGRTEDNCQDEA